MIWKHFLVFRLSVTRSMNSDLIISPRMENSPVSMPKAKQADTVMMMSLHSRAMPMFSAVCFFRIIAMISVPPEEASRLNRIAEPTAGSPTAKSSSTRGWEVIGALIGQTISSSCNVPDISREAYTVLTPKDFPKTANPRASRAILMIVTSVPGVMDGT